jgi:hypothetical protein
MANLRKFKTNGSSNKWMEWEIKMYSFLDDVAIDCKFMLEASRKATHYCANCWGVGIGMGFFAFKGFPFILNGILLLYGIQLIMCTFLCLCIPKYICI